MKKATNMISQIAALLIVFSGLIYVFSVLIEGFPKVWTFINSQFFVAMLTLFVGLMAYLLYLKQKSDYRKNIANLILQEIRFAEQRLREARDREHTYLLSDKLLPTNSWHANIHLFVSVLEENQVDTISKFYSRVEFLDHLIKEIGNDVAFPKNNSSAPVFIQPNNFPQAGNPVGTPNLQPVQIRIGQENPAQAILKLVSKEIELVYNSPAVDALRNIATS